MGLKKVRTPAFSTLKKVRVPALSSNIRQIITLKNAGTLTFVTFFHPKNFKHPNFCPIFTPKQYKYAVCWWIFTPKSMENIIFIKQSPKKTKNRKNSGFFRRKIPTPLRTRSHFAAGTPFLRGTHLPRREHTYVRVPTKLLPLIGALCYELWPLDFGL